MTFDLAHWPQILLIVLMVIEVFIFCAKDGDPRAPFDAKDKALNIAFFSWLLWMGGFFS